MLMLFVMTALASPPAGSWSAALSHPRGSCETLGDELEFEQTWALSILVTSGTDPGMVTAQVAGSIAPTLKGRPDGAHYVLTGLTRDGTMYADLTYDEATKEFVGRRVLAWSAALKAADGEPRACFIEHDLRISYRPPGWKPAEAVLAPTAMLPADAGAVCHYWIGASGCVAVESQQMLRITLANDNMAVVLRNVSRGPKSSWSGFLPDGREVKAEEVQLENGGTNVADCGATRITVTIGGSTWSTNAGVPCMD